MTLKEENEMLKRHLEELDEVIYHCTDAHRLRNRQKKELEEMRGKK